ncbi:alpha-L-fucosidase [Thermobifida alba]|uniref:alpha-L-fucosidase n=1 Tax=Thermobifida alba TaxID=53522 RepID=A0ABY4L3H4_THEAE|nr:alpha-L-fucosidase [Thermobifida alba]UPT20840.1 alpha-L-fucosidase [Thermobifida alba]
MPTDPQTLPTPDWFDRAKLGIFVHWTASAIPGYAPLPQSSVLDRDASASYDPEAFEFDPQADVHGHAWRTMPEAGFYHHMMNVPGSATARYHTEHYGNLSFAAFVERFRTRSVPSLRPDHWAELFVRCGARYVVLCTKTEDGFLLWPSGHPNPHCRGWQSDRDVVGELADAVRRRGMRFGAYYSGGWDFTFGHGTSLADMMPGDPAYRGYVEAHWRELVTRYRPSVLWNDYGQSPEGLDVAHLFRWYREHVPDGVVNDRFDFTQATGDLHADFRTPEYTTTGTPERKWEACRGLGYGFGYNRQESESDLISATELIHVFADIVARGGNLLLGVGPTGTGEIPWTQQRRLLELGEWVRTNADAIYDTRPWTRTGGVNDEGLHIRYTTDGDAVYAIVLGTPRGDSVELDVALTARAQASLLGTSGPLPWSGSPNGIRIRLPDRLAERPAAVFRLEPAEAVSDRTPRGRG